MLLLESKLQSLVFSASSGHNYPLGTLAWTLWTKYGLYGLFFQRQISPQFPWQIRKIRGNGPKLTPSELLVHCLKCFFLKEIEHIGKTLWGIVQILSLSASSGCLESRVGWLLAAAVSLGLSAWNSCLHCGNTLLFSGIYSKHKNHKRLGFFTFFSPCLSLYFWGKTNCQFRGSNCQIKHLFKFRLLKGVGTFDRHDQGVVNFFFFNQLEKQKANEYHNDGNNGTAPQIGRV